MPDVFKQTLGAHRVSVLTTLDNAATPFITLSGDPRKDSNTIRSYWKHNRGLELLKGTERESALNFLSQLENYGVFVVPSGELESWLPYLNVPTGNKKEWLPTMFIKMGEDPTHSDYVHPTGDDVWEFIGRVKGWADSSSRLGIPT